MKPARILLPAASAAPSVHNSDRILKAKPNKRQAVSRACNSCRKIKCKCDGVRPACAKCVERDSPCVYDTEEGVSRNASLRNSNAVLIARIGKYDNTLAAILANNPSPDVRQHIDALRANNNLGQHNNEFPMESPSSIDPDPDPDTGQDEGHYAEQAGSYQGPQQRFNTQSSGNYNQAFHSREPEMREVLDESWPGRNTLGREAFAAPDIRLVGGYSPNDGRISGLQFGWHPSLVVNMSQEIMSSLSTEERPEVMHDRLYRSTLNNKRFTDPEAQHSEAFLRAEGDENADGSSPIQSPVWRYHHANDSSAYSTSFFPPPGSVAAYGNLPMSSAILTNGYPPSTQRQQLLNYRVPEHTIPSILVDEGSVLALMYIKFKDAALHSIANGSTSVPDVLGDANIVNVDLLFRERAANDKMTVCNWACELVKNLPDFDLFVKLAWIGFLTKLMRWFIHPSADTYSRVPSMIKPIRSQRMIPHSPALDLCPHPGMRQALMQNYRDWITPTVIANGGGVQCWPGGMETAVDFSPLTARASLSTEFQEYTEVQQNWTYPPSIISTFPEATDYNVVIRENQGPGWRAHGKRRQEPGSYASTGSNASADAYDLRTDEIFSAAAHADANMIELIQGYDTVFVDNEKEIREKYVPNDFYESTQKRLKYSL